jgi:outer membrane protein assembly factor BamB
MRLRTVAVLLVLVGSLAGVAVVGFGLSSAGGDLTERWTSDTPRETQFNHHAIGAGPDGETIVAPVAELPNADVPITNTSCALVRLTPENGAVDWRTGMPAEDCFTHALTEPAIEDVDADGALEALVSTTEDALIAYDAATGTEEWRVPLSSYGYGRPTVANVTAAPGPEVVTSDISGGLVVAHGNGTVAWRLRLNETGLPDTSVWARPLVGDVDADGRPEVFAANNDGSVLLTHTGSVEWRQDSSTEFVALGQADDDPARELFTAGQPGLRAYDGATGEPEWERELTNTRIRAAADTDGDGTAELFAGRVGGRVLALDGASGETEWSTTVAQPDDMIVPPPVLGDVNDDGTQEVVAVTNAGAVVVLDATSGNELAVFKRDTPIWTFPTVADIDGDGAAEVLVRYGDGRVTALDYDEE